MNIENSIQKSMSLEIKEKTIFDQAQKYAYEYLNTVFEVLKVFQKYK